jgi:hypothetical protein
VTAAAPNPARRRRWPWVLGAVVVLLVAVVAGAPAGLVARVVAGADERVRLLDAAGSAFDGSARLLVEGRDLGRLAWTASAAALGSGRLGADLVLTGPDLVVRGRASVGADRALTVEDLVARVGEARLDAILRPYAIEPSGELRIGGPARLRVEAGRLTAAEGEGTWSGGPVRYRLGGQVFFADLPPLTATLATRDGVPVAVVSDPAGAPLLDASLRTDGWVDLRMRYRMAALAGFPWPDPPAPDTIVLELSEQVL